MTITTEIKSAGTLTSNLNPLTLLGPGRCPDRAGPGRRTRHLSDPMGTGKKQRARMGKKAPDPVGGVWIVAGPQKSLLRRAGAKSPSWLGHSAQNGGLGSRGCSRCLVQVQGTACAMSGKSDRLRA